MPANQWVTQSFTEIQTMFGFISNPINMGTKSTLIVMLQLKRDETDNGVHEPLVTISTIDKKYYFYVRSDLLTLLQY